VLQMTELSAPQVLNIATVNAGQLFATLQRGPDGSAVARLLSSGRLMISDIVQQQ
jgi:hypothetical protein